MTAPIEPMEAVKVLRDALAHAESVYRLNIVSDGEPSSTLENMQRALRLTAQVEAPTSEPVARIGRDPTSKLKYIDWLVDHTKFAVGSHLYATPQALPDNAPTSEPINMILHCPSCGLQHIDAPDQRTENWKNELHRSHLCHRCGHIWRPADVPTNGVAAIATKGKADSPVAPQALPTTEQAKPSLICSKCGVDRFKSPCVDHWMCPMAGTPQVSAAKPGLSGLSIAAIAREHFGNPIPQEAYAFARAILATQEVAQAKPDASEPLSRSTGMRCTICCARAGEPHLANCPEGEL